MTNKLIFGEAAHSCSCIGPQNGQPYCPCQMRAFGVYERGGRWVQPERDPCLASPFWWASGGRSVRPMGWLMKPVKGKFKP